MSRLKRYDAISHPDEFVRQAWRLNDIIRNLSSTLKCGTPHYTAINGLGSNFAETVRQVTGKEHPWTGNGPIPGLLQYASRNNDDAN